MVPHPVHGGTGSIPSVSITHHATAIRAFPLDGPNPRGVQPNSPGPDWRAHRPIFQCGFRRCATASPNNPVRAGALGADGVEASPPKSMEGPVPHLIIPRLRTPGHSAFPGPANGSASWLDLPTWGQGDPEPITAVPVRREVVAAIGRTAIPRAGTPAPAEHHAGRSRSRPQ